MTGEPAGGTLTPENWWANLPPPGIWQMLATRNGNEAISSGDW